MLNCCKYQWWPWCGLGNNCMSESGGTLSCWASCLQWHPLTNPWYCRASGWAHYRQFHKHSRLEESNQESSEVTWWVLEVHIISQPLVDHMDHVEGRRVLVIHIQPHLSHLNSWLGHHVQHLNVGSRINHETLWKEEVWHNIAYIVHNPWNHHIKCELSRHYHEYLCRAHAETSVNPPVHLVLVEKNQTMPSYTGVFDFI